MSSEVKTSSTASGAVRLHKSKTPLIIILVIVGVLLLASALFARWWFVDRVAFTINGKVYTRTQYSNMMSAAAKNGVPKGEATTYYIETEKKRAAAEKLSIKPTDASLETIAANTYDSKAYTSLDDWQRERVYEQSLQPATEFVKNGGYQGAYFNFPFSAKFQALSYYQINKKSPTPDGYGDQKAIDADKEYATQKRDYYYDFIKKGGSEKQAVEEIRNDPKLSLVSASNGSSTFQTDKNGLEQLSSAISANWRQKIDPSLFKGKDSVGVSQIMTRKVMNVTLPDKPVVDGGYYFVKFDSYSDGNPNIETEFKDTLNSVKVVKNV